MNKYSILVAGVGEMTRHGLRIEHMVRAATAAEAVERIRRAYPGRTVVPLRCRNETNGGRDEPACVRAE